MYGDNIELQYDIINPVTKNNKPRYDKEDNIFFFPVKKAYRYYIEARKIDPNTNDTSYYILVAKDRFNINCRLCEVNGYGKCKFHPKGELKEYIARECSERGNINCDLIDSNALYDTYAII